MSPSDVLVRLAGSVAGSLLLGLRLPDGHTWGGTAERFQLEDALALLDPAGPRLHFGTRPRGGRKSSDAAALALALLLTEAPAGARLYGFAADVDQAALLVDSMRGYVDATPGLSGALDVRERKVLVRATGASFEAIAADAPSAYGRRPWLTVVDELAAWPATRSTGRLWEAIFSAVVKVEGSRLLVITSAGDPNSLAAKVVGRAKVSAAWRVSEVPGPLRYVDPGALDEQRAILLPSAYARLHLNTWTAPEDSLISRDALDLLVTHAGPLDPQPGCTYRAGLDIGLTNDRTALVVAHTAHDAPSRIVVDLVHRLQGSRRRPVALSDVEAAVEQASHTYPGLRVLLDPWQGIGSAQRLRARGVQIQEWTFTGTSVGHLASSLYRALNEGRVGLPADEDLLDELAAVRLRPNSTGAVRLDHGAGEHDDQATALALAVLALSEQVGGVAGVSVPTGTIRTASVPPSSLAGELAAIAASGPYIDPRTWWPVRSDSGRIPRGVL